MAPTAPAADELPVTVAAQSVDAGSAAPPARPSRRSAGGRFWLLLACGLATLLRFARIDAQSLWYDEGISAYQLTRSYADIVRAAAGDTHPPLYYWLLKAWASIFGATEFGLRSLSATMGVAMVALTFFIGRRLFGPRVAGLAALLLAVSPLAVYYSQEVRMYTLVAALGLLAAWAYLSRSDSVFAPEPASAGRPGWAPAADWLYAVTAAATLYSQYLGAALLAAINLHALVWYRALGGRAGRTRWLAANLAAALLFAPWLPTFLDQSRQRALSTTPRTASGLLSETLSAYGGGLAGGPAAVLVGALLLSLASISIVFGLAARNRREVSFALLLWLMPLALVLTLGLRSGLFESRYLLLSLPGLLLLAADGVARVVRLIDRKSRLVAAMVGMYGLVAVLVPTSDALQRQYFDPALARDDYRGLVRQIESQAQAGDAIILAAPNQVEVFTFYYRGSLPLYPLPARRPIDEADTRARLERIKAQHARVWLVSWALRQADPRGLIEVWLAQKGFQVSHRWFGSVQLALFGLASAEAGEKRVDLPLDNGITLRGFQLGSSEAGAGETVPLTLVWVADQQPAQRWKVFTHLLDSQRQVVAQRDAEPSNDLRPTTTWQPGEVVEDRYGLLVPPGTPPGAYTLEVGMYRESGERATFLGRGDALELAQITVR